MITKNICYISSLALGSLNSNPNQQLAKMTTLELTEQRLIGESNAIGEVLEQVSLLAAIARPILVVGERGTGKELIAHRLHYLSPRWQNPFITINCASLNEALLETELFGHEAGAFTGAQRRHHGRFERADGGTLFLDEVATMSDRLQEKLLRVIEYGEFERVGGQQPIRVNVRLVCATHEHLPARVAAGTFRADLLDRLAFDVITLPPLRARQDDILLLAHFFANNLAAELGHIGFSGFSATVMQQLQQHAWPGNVRELRNVIERSVYRYGQPDQPLDRLCINPFSSPWRPERAAETTPTVKIPVNWQAHMAEYERHLLAELLQAARFNQRMAAQMVGLSYDQLRGLIKKHGLSTRPPEMSNN